MSICIEWCTFWGRSCVRWESVVMREEGLERRDHGRTVRSSHADGTAGKGWKGDDCRR
jgi:hypothetical protein